jgi:5-enolpyruvylshikimate-3-phosphate synthase
MFDALRRGGIASFERREGSFPPRLFGGTLKSGLRSVERNISSQFVSRLAGPHCKRGLELTVDGDIVQSQRVQITLALMRHFGASIQVDSAFQKFSAASTDELLTIRTSVGASVAIVGTVFVAYFQHRQLSGAA